MRWAVVFGGALVLALSGAAQAQGQAGTLPVPQPVDLAPPSVAATKGRPVPPVPKGNPAIWVTQNDYPPQAMRQGIQGATTFLLTIGPDGLVSACKIVDSSGWPLLDQTTCALLTSRATFHPARDAEGRPTSGTYRNRIRWVLPNREDPSVPRSPIDLVAESQIVTFTVEVDGTATNCVHLRNGVPTEDAKVRMPCGLGAIFAPVTDAQGKPVRKNVKIESSTTLSDPAP